MPKLNTQETTYTRKAQVLDTGVVLYFTIEEDKGLVKAKRLPRSKEGDPVLSSARKVKDEGTKRFDVLRATLTKHLRSLGVQISHGNLIYAPDTNAEELRLRVASARGAIGDFNVKAESMGWEVRGKLSAVFVPMTEENSASVKENVRIAMRENFRTLYELIGLGRADDAKALIKEMTDGHNLYRPSDKDPYVHALDRAWRDVRAMMQSNDWVAYGQKLDLSYINFCESFYGSPVDADV